MWHLQQQEISYRHATRLNQRGPQTTINTPQNGQLYNIRICKLGDETKTSESMGYEVALVDIKRSHLATESILGKRNKQWRQLFYKTSTPNSPSSNASSIYTHHKLIEENSSYHKIIRGCVELSTRYSFLYQIPEGDTRKTTIYDP